MDRLLRRLLPRLGSALPWRREELGRIVRYLLVTLIERLVFKVGEDRVLIREVWYRREVSVGRDTE